MKNYLLTLVVIFGLTAAVSADTIKATVNGMVCGFCATGIEKTFKAQPEVKTVDVAWKTSWSPFRQSKGKHCKTQKLRSCSATPATPSSLLHDRNNERANHYSGDPDNSQLL